MIVETQIGKIDLTGNLIINEINYEYLSRVIRDLEIDSYEEPPNQYKFGYWSEYALIEFNKAIEDEMNRLGVTYNK